MTAPGDEDLATLIVREQRGFRTILFAGLVTLLLMALMSAAMGVYFYMVSSNLAATTEQLRRDAFDTRRSIAAQNNRLVAQERAVRRAYTDIRIAAGGGVEIEATPQRIAETQEAVALYLLRGHTPSMSDQRAIGQFAVRDNAAITPAAKALMRGAWSLINFENSNEQIDAAAEELPDALQEALAAFEAAHADPALAPLARTGIASIRFMDASSGRHNYSEAACGAVFEALGEVRNGAAAPRPLYWRAQCERKLGRTADALSHYALDLAATAPSAREAAQGGGRGRRAEAENQLALDAYHGVGTTLIAAADLPADTPGLADALAVAAQWCPRDEADAARSERMAMALSCLRQAISLRRELGQTDNQVSGSGENLSFAYLRDGDFDAAYQHTIAVERTGLFAWNEAVRALAASRATVGPRGERRAAAAAARRNVSMFRVGQFNICELQALMNEADFEALQAIIREEHPGEDVRCSAR